MNLKPCIRAILFSPKIKVGTHKTAIYSTVRVHFLKFRSQFNIFCLRLISIESLESNFAAISLICGCILNCFASLVQPYFGVHTARGISTNQIHLICCGTVSMSGQYGACKQNGQTIMIWLRLGVKRYTAYYDISWYSHRDTYRNTEKLAKIHIVSV